MNSGCKNQNILKRSIKITVDFCLKLVLIIPPTGSVYGKGFSVVL